VRRALPSQRVNPLATPTVGAACAASNPKVARLSRGLSAKQIEILEVLAHGASRCH